MGTSCISPRAEPITSCSTQVGPVLLGVGKEGSWTFCPSTCFIWTFFSHISKGSFCLLAEGAVSHGCGPRKPSPCQPEGRCGLGDGDSSQGPTGAFSQVPAGVPTDLGLVEALCLFHFLCLLQPLFFTRESRGPSIRCHAKQRLMTGCSNKV